MTSGSRLPVPKHDIAYTREELEAIGFALYDEYKGKSTWRRGRSEGYGFREVDGKYMRGPC